MRHRHTHNHPHHDHSRRRFLMFPFVLLFLAASGAAVMLLWNAILPPLLGVKFISYWQSVGLLALCRLLFGHFGGGRPGDNHHPRWRNHTRQGWGKAHSAMRQRLMRMNEDERRRFTEELKKRMRP